MTNSELFLEIRRIIREELELALSKQRKTPILSSTNQKVTEKKQVNSNRDRIKEKLESIRNIQEKRIHGIDVELNEDDLEEIKKTTPDLNQTRQAVLENINRDYSNLIKKIDKP